MSDLEPWRQHAIYAIGAVAILILVSLGRLWLAYSVSDWRWYRQWRGGHWEGWYLDSPANCFSWINEKWCDKRHLEWPLCRPGLGRGTPTCEEWPIMPRWKIWLLWRADIPRRSP